MECTDLLLTCADSGMLGEHSQAKAFSFTGISRMHTSNHITMSFNPIPLSTALRYILHELIEEISICDCSGARELTVGYESSSENWMLLFTQDIL